MSVSQEHYESMVRRAEICLKALTSHTSGRSRQTGMARALHAAISEAHERMDLAWAVLRIPSEGGSAAEQRYRLINAGEISLCYTIIRQIYDELAILNVIPKEDQTEPTTQDLIQAARKHEKPYKRIHRSKVKT